MSRRRRPFAPVLVWALLVGLASVTPPQFFGAPSTGGGVLPVAVPRFDLVLHLFGYAVLAGFLVRAANAGPVGGTRPRALALFLAVLAATAFGLGIEGVQAVLTYRTASLLDAAVNGAGAALGSLAATWAAGRRRKSATSPGR